MGALSRCEETRHDGYSLPYETQGAGLFDVLIVLDGIVDFIRQVWLSAFIMAEETTAANESDMKHLQTPQGKAHQAKGTPVMPDKGYDSAENRGALSSMRLKASSCLRRRITSR